MAGSAPPFPTYAAAFHTVRRKWFYGTMIEPAEAQAITAEVARSRLRRHHQALPCGRNLLVNSEFRDTAYSGGPGACYLRRARAAPNVESKSFEWLENYRFVQTVRSDHGRLGDGRERDQ